MRKGTAIRMAVLVGATTIGMAWAPHAADAATPRCRGEEVTINTATGGDDVIIGTPNQDIINGLGGNDIIEGMGGDDIICGAEGNDIIKTRDGADTVIGGPGNDTLTLGAGNDYGFGGSYSSTMSISADDGDDYIDGGPGQEQALIGDNAVYALDSTASGHGGNDTIVDADGAFLVVGGHVSCFYIASGYDGGDKISLGGNANDVGRRRSPRQQPRRVGQRPGRRRHHHRRRRGHRDLRRASNGQGVSVRRRPRPRVDRRRRRHHLRRRQRRQLQRRQRHRQGPVQGLRDRLLGPVTRQHQLTATCRCQISDFPRPDTDTCAYGDGPWPWVTYGGQRLRTRSWRRGSRRRGSSTIR